jgi:hypothetical protein
MSIAASTHPLRSSEARGLAFSSFIVIGSFPDSRVSGNIAD